LIAERWALVFFAEATLAGGVVLFGGLVAVLLGGEEAGAAFVVDGLGFVVFEDLDRRGDLLSVGREDDAGDGP